MKSWLNQHQIAFFKAIGRLYQAPLNTLLSLLVIGIALTLPTAGYLLIENMRTLSDQSPGIQQISIFMKVEASRKATDEIDARLKSAAIGHWRFVPKEDALKSIQNKEGMAEIIASLPKNPLPDAFIVEPINTTPEALEDLRQTFSVWPQVAHVQLDSAWVRRFDAFLRLAKLTVSLLSIIFGTGLVAITFNTIRLQLISHAAEIEVARLIGATNAFVRRPFYYFGTLQGILGGLLAAFLVALGFRLLDAPISELSQLYGGHFSLAGPSYKEVLMLAGIGGALGWLGAQLSVSLSLRQLKV